MSSLKSDDVERTSATSKDALIDNNENSNSSATPEMQDARMELYGTDNDSDKKLSDSNVSGGSSDSVAGGSNVEVLMGDETGVINPYLGCTKFFDEPGVMELQGDGREVGVDFDDEVTVVRRREKKKKRRKCSGCGHPEVSTVTQQHSIKTKLIFISGLL